MILFRVLIGSLRYSGLFSLTSVNSFNVDLLKLFFFFVSSFQLLIFPSQCLRALGDSKESSSFAGSLCCRLLASALLGK